jgi:hypothetical protein
MRRSGLLFLHSRRMPHGGFPLPLRQQCLLLLTLAHEKIPRLLLSLLLALPLLEDIIPRSLLLLHLLLTLPFCPCSMLLKQHGTSPLLSLLLLQPLLVCVTILSP